MREAAGWVTFLADLITLILGVIALIAVIKNRKKLNALFRFIAAKIHNDRSFRIRETLKKIEERSATKKQIRAEIFCLLGQLKGQLKPYATHPGFKPMYDELTTLEQRPETLTEATKLRLVHEVDSAL